MYKGFETFKLCCEVRANFSTICLLSKRMSLLIGRGDHERQKFELEARLPDVPQEWIPFRYTRLLAQTSLFLRRSRISSTRKGWSPRGPTKNVVDEGILSLSYYTYQIEIREIIVQSLTCASIWSLIGTKNYALNDSLRKPWNYDYAFRAEERN